MNQVIRLGEILPWAEPLLRAGARRVVALPGVPPPPLHAYAAPGGKRPGDDADLEDEWATADPAEPGAPPSPEEPRSSDSVNPPP